MIDWDELVLGPVMGIFGEGQATDPSSWPTYYPARGGSFQLEGAVYDSEYQKVTVLADGSTTTTRHPVLGVRERLFQVPPAQGEGVSIPSESMTFAVADVQPDGHGHILLVLMETDA